MMLALLLGACGSSTTPTTASTTAPIGSTTVAATTAASTTSAATTASSGTSVAATTAVSSAAAATPIASADSSLKTEIRIADGLRQNETALLKSQIDAFKKAYPNVKVTSVHYNPQELGELIKAGAGTAQVPDLIIAPSDYVTDWTIESKALQPADKIFDASLLKGYAPNALGASQLGEVQWGVPYNYGNVAVLLYNTKLVATPPTTTDQMIQIAKDLRDKPADAKKREQVFGMALDLNQPIWFAAFLGGFGGSLMDANNQPTLNTPEMVKTLQFYQSLINKDKVATPQLEFGDNQMVYAFRDGRLGMMVANDWNISDYGSPAKGKLAAKLAAPTPTAAASPSPAASGLGITPGANDYSDKFELGVARLPNVSATGKPAAPLLDNKALFIGGQTKGDQLKAAKAFVEFLAKPQQQQAMIEAGFVPTTQAALNSEDLKANPLLSGLAAQLAVAKPMPAGLEIRAVWDALLPNLQAVVAETMTPQEASRKMQQTALENIKALKS